MRAKISNLTNNIEMLFKQKDLVGVASCSSWDGKGNLTWTTSGCETEKVNNNTIKCSCSHLTFFAVLMSPPDVNANIT
ncbi:adhesion G protein-coupled receptor E5-like [Megalobrama amblycephala]|uniref:adhesion G protein-coupled receptor E5-like n=1 Tax=Megalobrama amblycephala TaxID=75352 RepID=UPI002013EAF4|nr:adhesion G protein-coupled receptor E5-like [Megalobrama amblycephala]